MACKVSVRKSPGWGMTMNTESLTLFLDGDVPLDLFAQAMGRFSRLVSELSEEVGTDTEITWTVSDLVAGSAAITVSGVSTQAEAVARVSRAYVIVGQSLAAQQPIPFSSAVVRAATDLTKVLDDQVTSLRFESGDESAIVTVGEINRQPAKRVGAYGSVEGRIETLTSRKGPGFTLYDSIHDRPVRCDLRDDQRDMVREAWDRHVLVRGWVNREPIHGRPVSIKPVTSIEILKARVPGAYRQARAVVPFIEGRPPAHESVRKMRDA